MSTPIKSLAKNYLRYWPSAGAIADNSPPTLRRFVMAQPAIVDRELIWAAFTKQAGAKDTEKLNEQALLKWFGNFPHASKHCDAALKTGRYKTYLELITAAYNKEVAIVDAIVLGFLKQQIQEFENS